MGPDLSCPIARSLTVLGERWTLLVMREAVSGTTRFADYRDNLGIATDVLSDRLRKLVEHGLLARVPYQEPGSRSRDAYEVTSAGRDVMVVLGALQEWGAENVPRAGAPLVERRRISDGARLRVAFVDDAGREVPVDDVEFTLTAG
jgi:DNA-binding HxlR family transcriptional regulator